jgi:integrase
MQRGEKGQGTVYERADGRFVAALRFEKGGKPVVRYAKTRAEARRKLVVLRKQRDAGIREGQTTPKLAAYLTDWLDDVKAPRVRPHTLAVYEDRANLLTARIGHVRIGDLTPARVRRCQSDLLDQNLAPRYVAAIMSLLRSALRDAVNDRVLSWNPCDAVQVPAGSSATTATMQTLSLAQVQALFAATRESRWYSLWVLLTMTGLRIGEACALRWDDADYESGKTLIVRRSLSKAPGGGWRFENPKTKTSARTIELGDLVCTALREHRQRQRKEKLAAFEWEEHGDLIFTGEHGQPVANNTVRKALRLALTKAELPAIRIHDLRHTCATIHLHELGTPPKVVQEMLGHASITMTQDIYGHVMPGMHRDAADRLNARMTQGG